mgnify:FL=1
MLNQTLLVGRIVSKPELNQTETGKNYASITIAVPKSYVNENGEHEANFIDLTAWNERIVKKSDHLLKGDLVLIEASIQTRLVEKEGKKTKYTDIIVDNIDYLTHSKNQDKTILNDDIEEEMDK